MALECTFVKSSLFSFMIKIWKQSYQMLKSTNINSVQKFNFSKVFFSLTTFDCLVSFFATFFCNTSCVNFINIFVQIFLAQNSTPFFGKRRTDLPNFDLWFQSLTLLVKWNGKFFCQTPYIGVFLLGQKAWWNWLLVQHFFCSLTD